MRLAQASPCESKFQSFFVHPKESSLINSNSKKHIFPESCFQQVLLKILRGNREGLRAHPTSISFINIILYSIFLFFLKSFFCHPIIYDFDNSLTFHKPMALSSTNQQLPEALHTGLPCHLNSLQPGLHLASFPLYDQTTADRPSFK